MSVAIAVLFAVAAAAFCAGLATGEETTPPIGWFAVILMAMAFGAVLGVAVCDG